MFVVGETRGSFLYSYKSQSFTYAYAAALGLEPVMVKVVKATDSAPDVYPAKVKVTVAVALPSKKAEQHVLQKLLDDHFVADLMRELAFYRYDVKAGDVEQVPFTITTESQVNYKEDGAEGIKCRKMPCAECHSDQTCRWCLSDGMCHSTQGTCDKWSYESAYIGCKSRNSPIPTSSPTYEPTEDGEMTGVAEEDGTSLGNNEQQLEDMAFGLGFDTAQCHLPQQLQSKAACTHQVLLLVGTTAVCCIGILWATYRILRANRVQDTYSEIEEDVDEEEDDEYGIGSLTDDALFFFSGQTGNSNRFEGI